MSLLRHLPQLHYSGLTIVLSNPSRFDTEKLLTSTGGHFLCVDILYQLGITRYNCDIRLADSVKEPLCKNTKCVLLLGSKAMTLWLPSEIVKDNKLDNLRGSPYTIQEVTYMCSYAPQDCVDRQNWESQINPDVLDWLEEEVKKRQDNDPLGMKRRKGLTFRANYRFWLKKDVEKLVNILINFQGKPPQDEQAHYIIYPKSSEILSLLSYTNSKCLYFDMETERKTNRITCFSFAYDLSAIYVVPVVLPDYSFAYSELTLALIFKALAVAIKNNTLVAHNGAAFDFLILAWLYKIPIYKVYDTMVAAHRCYSMVEKGLGHQTSLWTNEVYHKDEAQFAFGNREQALNLWQYCGKDVSTMIRIHRAITVYAKTQKGLEASIEQAMLSIRPYLITSLMGISYRQDKVVEIMAENDRLMMAYLKIIEWFIGKESYALLKKKSKKGFPGSNSQCCMYFHAMLGYKVMGRSKKTGKPSLDEKRMLKLKLVYENPVIDLCIAYRRAAKETGTLKFVPWSINNKMIVIE